MTYVGSEVVVYIYNMADLALKKQVTKESITVQQTSTGTPCKMKEWTEQPQSDPEEENRDEEEDREEALEAESLTEVVQEEVARRQQLSGEELTEFIEVEEVRELLYDVLR